MNSEAIAQIAHETTPVNARRVSMTPSGFLVSADAHSSPRTIGSFLTTFRDCEPERPAPAHLALDPHPPTVQLDQFPAHGSPQPGSFRPLLRPPHLPALLEC